MNFSKIDVISVVFVAHRNVIKNFEKYVDKIGIKIDLHTVQKTTSFGDSKNIEKSARMLTKNKGERLVKEPLVIGYNQLPC